MADGLPEGFIFIAVLGKGDATGSAIVDEQKQEEVAVKLIEREQVDEKDKEKYLRREVIYQWRLRRHPNIVSFRELRTSLTHVGIVMDYAGQKDLHDYVAQQG